MHHEEAMQHEAHAVVHEIAGEHCLMTALVCDDPDAGEDEPLSQTVDCPREPLRGRGFERRNLLCTVKKRNHQREIADDKSRCAKI